MKNRFSILNLFASFLVFAAATPAFAADELSPYLDGAEHTISEREYNDLRSYVERAQKILIETLEESIGYSGTELRDHLLGGIQSALQSTGLRNELLLFRYVLLRAVKVDEFYTKNDTGAEIAQLSAQIVLLPAIESALNYYQSSDLPRLATTTVPSPDWLSFAADQVPQLLRAVDLAPTRATKIGIARSALGWTAKALNSSHERRTAEVADHIVRLGELYNHRNRKHAQYVTRAQDALLTVYKAYRKPLPTITLAPASAGQDLKMRRGSFLSLSRPFFRKNGAVATIGKRTGGTDNGLGTLTRLTIFLGAGVSAAYDENSAGDVDTRKAATVAIDAAAVARAEVGDPLMFSAHGSLSAGVAAAGKVNEWNYNVSVRGSANAVVVFGVFGAIERNVFNEFEETLLRGGWSPHGIIRLANTDYLLIRFYAGGLVATLCGNAAINSESCVSGDASNASPMLGGSMVLKLKRASVEFDANYAYFDSAGVIDASATDVDVGRFSFDGSVNLPLRLLVKNDSLQLKGQVVNYGPDGPSNSAGFVFYGLKW